MIKRIKVHNLNALKDPTYRFPGNYGVEKFLELFSGECNSVVQVLCAVFQLINRDKSKWCLWPGD